MIKRILVALDPDSDTQTAIRYATHIAKLYDAQVTGLAVIDMGNIEAGIRGGGIGSMYYVDKLKENLTAEAREKARELLKEFESFLSGSGVRSAELVEEGVPFKRIINDMKYHDLLIMGKDPHFFYSHPEERTKTLAHIIEQTIAPTLIVGDAYRPVKHVVIAYDGSAPAARAFRGFINFKPFGTDLRVDIVHVHQGDQAESDLMLELAKEFAQAHGFQTEVVGINARDEMREIVSYCRQVNADLVVAGQHSETFLQRLTLGSSTNLLLKEFPAPIFMDR